MPFGNPVNVSSILISRSLLEMQGGFPDYNYADQLQTPSELGIKRDGSFDGIMRAVAGINYYSDAIGFGESTLFAKQAGMQQSPLGIRFFVDTGAMCSNGAKMYEYVDTIPKGIGSARLQKSMKDMGLPNMRGLGPGIVDDATSALNPIPLMDAMVRGGYAKCKQVTLPVGDAQGRTVSPHDPKNVWIKDPVQMKDGLPHQTRWVFDSWISPEEYETTPKTAEGFQNNILFSLKTSQVAAVALLGTLVAAIYFTQKTK